MFWLVMAAASQMSMPVLIDPKKPDIRLLYRADDYPAYLTKRNLAYVVKMRATVRPDGSIQECVAEQSSSNEKLDADTCGILVRRARLAGAKWIDGTPAYGVIRLPITWLTSDGYPDFSKMRRVTQPDLEVLVKKLPGGAKQQHVGVIIAADENGKPVDCRVDFPPPKASFQPLPQLVPLACPQAMAKVKLIPPQDAAGKGVRSVQTASVQFKEEGQ